MICGDLGSHLTLLARLPIVRALALAPPPFRTLPPARALDAGVIVHWTRLDGAVDRAWDVIAFLLLLLLLRAKDVFQEALE